MASTAPQPQEPGDGTAVPSAPRPDDARTGLDLPRVGPREWGYDDSQVEALLAPLLSEPDHDDRDQDVLPEPEQLRRATFKRQRGGYDPAAVDTAIDRLEDRAAAALAHRRLREQGTQSWDEHVDRQLDLVMGRLERPAGRRFRAPSSRTARGYSAHDVDRLCDQLLARLHRQEAPAPERIRDAVFAPAWGDDVYEEHQVDAFLDAVVDLLLMLD